MTDQFGQHWKQPPRDRIVLDDEHAICSRADFEQLLDYSGSRPTGAYVGKMWRTLFRGEWFLHWYGPHADPTKVSINFRRLLVVE
jgi:hypothetical protein